jgi:hypothetical protein
MAQEHRYIRGIDRTPDGCPTRLFMNDSPFNPRRSELRENYPPVIDQVVDSARLENGNDIVIRQEAAGSGTPNIDPTTVCYQQVSVYPFESFLDALHRELEVARE